uniref:C-type lectin domain-containing protein n=1 Tax=Terrapene triunguis TaxID=2587831 RepID=A0A674IVK0_9SAUR
MPGAAQTHRERQSLSQLRSGPALTDISILPTEPCSTAPPSTAQVQWGQQCLQDPLLITVPFPHPEGSGCKLCPRHWVPHRDKCYWLSEENQYWSRGRDDCSRRRSHLLVIQDREELVKNVLNFTIFVSLLMRAGQEALFLFFYQQTFERRKWTWVDGSPLNQTLFKVSGPAEENSCAAVKKNQIKSEICNTDYKWICQKEAVLI